MKNLSKLNADRFSALSISLIVIAISILLASRFNVHSSLLFLISVLEVALLSVVCVSAVKDLLVSKYFISKGQTRHYSSVNTDAKGVLLLAALGCAVSMTINVIVFGIAAALIVIFSAIVGRSLAEDEISKRTLIAEMTEDQKNFRSSVIDEASELMSRNEFERSLILVHSKRVGSIDYCVNYLPIEILMQDLEELKSRENFDLLDSLTSIASNRSTERRENAVLLDAIQYALSERLESAEDYRKYFN